MFAEQLSISACRDLKIKELVLSKCVTLKITSSIYMQFKQYYLFSDNLRYVI